MRQVSADVLLLGQSRPARRPRRRPGGRLALVTAIAAVAWGSSFGLSPPRPAAASSRSPVAVTEQWTPTAQVFDNGDGTTTANIYAAPIQAPAPTSASGWS